MVEHLEDGSIECNICIDRSGCQTCRRYTKDYETHMIHGRVRDESLEVCLSVSAKRTEDDSGSRKECQRTREYLGLKRIERKDESQEAIRAEFEQNTSQNH